MTKEIVNILESWLAGRVKELFNAEVTIDITEPVNFNFGDLSTNLPFKLAKIAKKSPGQIGEEILSASIPEIFDRAEIAGTGYINFWLAEGFLHNIIRNIIQSPEEWFLKDCRNQPENIQIEFVSANPTGPLNIVSARAASVGSTLANTLRSAGHDVTTEFYINDCGNQIQLLRKSFGARILQIKGENTAIPEDGYRGEYLRDYAHEYLESNSQTTSEKWILQRILHEQKETLAGFNTDFDVWFPESKIRESNKVAEILERLDIDGYTYKSDNALWFAASQVNSAVEDFVLVKSDGEWAYGLVDIAYHADKFEGRRFDRIYTILGPDHHGHKARMETAMKALGHDEKLIVLILQQVNLIEGGEKVKMSKRLGKLITMKELMDDVGVDAARYFFLARRMEAHLDFDLNLARNTSEENPVYYIQYAYARIISIIEFAENKGFSKEMISNVNFEILSEPEETALIRMLSRFPSEINKSAQQMQTHIIPFYLTELAKMFHNFYSKHRVVGDDRNISCARLALVFAVACTIRNGLDICGINAPDNM